MYDMKPNSPAGAMALGGILAAIAVTVMSMGTLIPVATYLCPMICMLLLQMVLKACGKRTAWAWYAAVAILSLLMAPDKEAAIVFSFLGYYPILKFRMDQRKGKWLWKAVYFNGSVLTAYWLMLNALGLEQVVKDLNESGILLTAVLLALGNVTFFLLDRLLTVGLRKRKWR